MFVREADLRTLGTGSGSEAREATEPEPEDGGSEEDPWLSLQHGARIALNTYIVEFHNWLALSAGGDREPGGRAVRLWHNQYIID